MTAIKIDKQEYGRLLVETLPAVIETEEENRRMIAIADRLMDKADRRTPEETRLLRLIATLCQDFEQRFYNVGEGVTPEALLADLLPIKTDAEHERLLAIVEPMMGRGESFSPEERNLFNLLVKLIQDYEDQHYPIEPTTRTERRAGKAESEDRSEGKRD